jgi:preprotein translocase subunit SecA
LLLGVITELWVDYLTQMEALRVSIGLEAYAQRDPLVQYKSRASELFQTLFGNMRLGVINRMFNLQLPIPGGAQPQGKRAKETLGAETAAEEAIFLPEAAEPEAVNGEADQEIQASEGEMEEVEESVLEGSASGQAEMPDRKSQVGAPSGSKSKKRRRSRR